jgi:hypothetical protein
MQPRHDCKDFQAREVGRLLARRYFERALRAIVVVWVVTREI